MAAAASLKLYYWPINFRGHFIQALLKYSGTPYEIASVPEMLALKNPVPDATNPVAFMAPPLLQDGQDIPILVPLQTGANAGVPRRYLV